MNKIGLALAGGGIKSYSELPVINFFMDEDISIDAISGTSMGSVLAALVSLGVDKKTLNQVAFKLEETMKERKAFTKVSPKVMPFIKDKLYGGYVDGDILETVFNEAIKPFGVTKIQDVKIPLAIPSVDIKTGKIVVFVSHPDKFTKLSEDWIIETDVDLAVAVRASCSFPFIISGCPYKDYVLIDGGVRMNTPSALVKAYGMDRIVAVTLHSQIKTFEEVNSIIPYGIRVLDLLRVDVDKSQLQDADLVINIPVDTINVFDVGKGQVGYNKGDLVMAQYKQRLLTLANNKTWLEKLEEKYNEYFR